MSTPSLPPHRTSKVLPNHGGITVHFQHRSTMLRVSRDRATLPAGAPETPLPVDCSGNASCPWPMDGNGTLGDCGWAMCDHVNGTRSYGQGKPGFAQLTCPLDALESQYLKDSGGDNGSDEPMLVGPGGAWLVGIGGNPKAVVVDHLDVDVTDIPLRNYCIDQFYCVCMAWSVPDDVLAKFATGCSFLSADTPNPENGHFTPLTDVDADDNVRIITWGAWCWASPAFLASVQPQCFVTFSALQFGADGYDSHGRHVSDQAAKWVALGGSSALVAPVVAAFPPKASPPPAPADPTEMPANGVTVPAV